MANIRSERLESGVERVWLTRPPVNALSGELLTELGAHFRALAEDTTCAAVVITGEGKAFAAGADISQFGGAGGKEIGDAFRSAFDAIVNLSRPVIAAINGYALGGGLELALACDLRMMADDGRVGLPEILLGIIPGAGGTQRLSRLIGAGRAKELIWSGRNIKADEALALGIVERVVPSDELVELATEWAAQFARGAVIAQGLAKRAIDGGLDGALADGLALEARAFVDAFATEDAKIGIASFLEHGPGKAVFTGR